MRLMVVLGLFTLPAFNVPAGEEKPGNDSKPGPADDTSWIRESSGDFCGTDHLWQARSPVWRTTEGACPTNGDCDVPTERDNFLLDDEEPMKFVRIRFAIFAADDGSDLAATEAEVRDQVAQLNADFAPYRFQFVSEMEVINDSRFRGPAIGWIFTYGITLMKDTYAENPDKQCNIFVTSTSPFFGGVGTFPWDPNALTNQGGILIDQGHVRAGNSVLTHEMGHNLGLWHTHHGVSEFPSTPPVCEQPCYESPGAANADEVGDFCADTPATPRNTDCDPVDGDDPCSGEAWEPTLPESYMSYGDECWDRFTDQQAARMHCWGEAITSGWFTTPPGGAGDADGDEDLDQDDVLYILDYLFTGGPAPDPLCRGDVDGSGSIAMVDALDLSDYLFSSGPAPVPTCPREVGDVNDDGYINADDVLFLFEYTFSGGPAPVPLCSGDLNDDGTVNASDGYYLQAFLYSGGPAPIDACP